jgi:hypothetical protein
VTRHSPVAFRVDYWDYIGWRGWAYGEPAAAKGDAGILKAALLGVGQTTRVAVGVNSVKVLHHDFVAMDLSY